MTERDRFSGRGTIPEKPHRARQDGRCLKSAQHARGSDVTGATEEFKLEKGS